jgi:hypothetical protein
VDDAYCPTGENDHLLNISRKEDRIAIAAAVMIGAACRINKFGNEKNAGVNLGKSIPDENKTPPGWRWGGRFAFCSVEQPSGWRWRGSIISPTAVASEYEGTGIMECVRFQEGMEYRVQMN